MTIYEVYKVRQKWWKQLSTLLPVTEIKTWHGNIWIWKSCYLITFVAPHYGNFNDVVETVLFPRCSRKTFTSMPVRARYGVSLWVHGQCWGTIGNADILLSPLEKFRMTRVKTGYSRVGLLLFQIESHKLDWKTSSKIGSLDNAGHKAGGGDKKVGRNIICDTDVVLRYNVPY